MNQDIYRYENNFFNIDNLSNRNGGLFSNKRYN